MAEPTRFRVYQPSLYPAWMLRPVGEAWSTAFGVLKDGYATAATEATTAHIIRTAPLDALPHIGFERDLEGLPGETTETYRARLEAAFDTWRLAGTDLGIINGLGALGFTNVEVKRNNQWDWDGNPGQTKWYRIWVILRPPFPIPLSPGGFTWGAGPLWGSTLWGITGDPAFLEAICRVVKKWKSTHAKLINVIVVFSGPIWGSGFTWGVDPWLGSAAYICGSGAGS